MQVCLSNCSGWKNLGSETTEGHAMVFARPPQEDSALAGLSILFSHSPVGACTLHRLTIPSLSAGPWRMAGCTHLPAPVNALRPWPGMMLSWQQLSSPRVSIFESLPQTKCSMAATLHWPQVSCTYLSPHSDHKLLHTLLEVKSNLNSYYKWNHTIFECHLWLSTQGDVTKFQLCHGSWQDSLCFKAECHSVMSA